MAPKIFVNKIIEKRYHVLTTLGEGGFGKVFRVYDKLTKKDFAMKIQLTAATESLQHEISMLGKLRRVPNVCQLFDSGVHEQAPFCIVQLLDDDVEKRRQNSQASKFSNATAHNVAIGTLQALRNIHAAGIVHGDVKPNNFATGVDKDKRKFFIFDFGTAKEHIKNGVVQGPVTFRDGICRGTPRYASLRQHRSQDNGRGDDLESWFYMTVENFTGVLPWEPDDDAATILSTKRSIAAADIIDGLFPEYADIYDEIFKLDFASEPNYVKIFFKLEVMSLKYKITPSDVFDWDKPAAASFDEAPEDK